VKSKNNGESVLGSNMGNEPRSESGTGTV